MSFLIQVGRGGGVDVRGEAGRGGGEFGGDGLGGDGGSVWDRSVGGGGLVESEKDGGGVVVDGGRGEGEAVREGRTGEFLAGMLMLAGVSLMVFVMMNWTRRRLRARRSSPAAAPDERLAEIRARAARADPIASAAVESEHVARRFAAMLDNKTRRLELLLDDTDARIARLERLLDLASERGVPEDGVVERFVGDGGVEGVGGGGDRAGFDEVEIDDGAVDPLTRDVYALADEGLAAAEIARRLEQHTGKVELILALRSA